MSLLLLYIVRRGCIMQLRFVIISKMKIFDIKKLYKLTNFIYLGNFTIRTLKTENLLSWISVYF